MDKKSLTEADIRSKFITPAMTAPGKWDLATQLREEVVFTMAMYFSASTQSPATAISGMSIATATSLRLGASYSLKPSMS